MTQKKRSDLPESVKKAVAEIGKAADSVEKDSSSIPTPEASVQQIKDLSAELRKPDEPVVVTKKGWQERAKQLKLVPKLPEKLSGDQHWKVVAKSAGKEALKSVGASLGYMVIMSAMAAGFALAVRSNDPRSLVSTLGSHDS